MTRFTSNRDGGKTDEQGLMRFLAGMFTIGYVSSTAGAWQVAQRGSGANMSVDVPVGDGLIGNTFTAPVYAYYNWIDAVENVVITTADPTNPRRDIIVAYLDKSIVQSATPDNPGAMKFVAVAGTPAGSPADPSDAAIQTAVGAGNPFIKLARVLVGAAVSNIVNANITDLRTPAALKLPYLYGGSNNTKGHLVPNLADDTIALIAAVQAFTNKTIDGTTNKVRAGGANSSLIDSAGNQEDIERRWNESGLLDYVASGGVPSTSGTLTTSITAIVAYLSGIRATAVLNTRAYTASKDTYVDMDSAGVLYFTEVTVAAAAPALTAGRLRVCVVTTSGSAVTAVKYGDTVANLFDSLGNPIRPLAADRQLLGYTEFTPGTSQTNSASQVNLGASITIIPGPSIRPIRIKMSGGSLDNTNAATGGLVADWQGTVGSGTQLAQYTEASVSAGVAYTVGEVEKIIIPVASTPITINTGIAQVAGGNAQLVTAAGNPLVLQAEYV